MLLPEAWPSNRSGRCEFIRHRFAFAYHRPRSQPDGWLSHAMSPVIRLRHCANCSHPVNPDQRCSRCGHAHGEAGRAERHKRNGYATQHWRNLRIAAIAAHPYCERCGSTRDLTGGHRRYPARTLADVEVQCRSCNSKDARGSFTT